MNIAVLFWFYKEPAVCENRLRLLREHNPDLRIYGLFGGSQEDAEHYRIALGAYLDDFYTTPFADRDWKWLNGDLMILDWFVRRGITLEWDSIAIVQWDMLVFDSLRNQFAGMKADEIFLSGFRALDEEFEAKWSWTKKPKWYSLTRKSKHRKEFERFKSYLKDNYDFTGAIYWCRFILQVFPRSFFEKYLTVKDRSIGMLEYKIPTYSRILGIPVFEKNLEVWTGEKTRKASRTPLNARPIEIEQDYIREELDLANGARLFHPYYKVWP